MLKEAGQAGALVSSWVPEETLRLADNAVIKWEAGDELARPLVLELFSLFLEYQHRPSKIGLIEIPEGVEIELSALSGAVSLRGEKQLRWSDSGPSVRKTGTPRVVCHDRQTLCLALGLKPEE